LFISAQAKTASILILTLILHPFRGAPLGSIPPCRRYPPWRAYKKTLKWGQKRGFLKKFKKSKKKIIFFHFFLALL